ncbi:replication protein A 14 kDa subunit-like [Neocloeon triangulifer]|uniref:replication protein A 14 kDa subunit-like n=1 Tax=Neocloeon triangulifer TaxID=2078957 RepID=UPI00286EEFB5|nr:replication protein A 14 kDa subunit-like [Neocloeon triangulifer]
MEIDTAENERFVALGSMLKNLVGNEVCLVGSVTDVHSTGTSIKLVTTDKVNVNVTFDNQEEIMKGQCVRVWGSVVGPNAIAGESVWIFKAHSSLHDDDVKKSPNSIFDEEAYNAAVKVYNELKEFVHKQEAIIPEN